MRARLLLLCVLGGIGWTSESLAEEAPRRAGVKLGEIRANAGRESQGRDFQWIVRREFSKLAARHKAARPGVVSISLVELEGEPSSVRCVVSATLRDERGGELFAFLRGEASVLGGEGPTRTFDAMRAAVRSALSRLGAGRAHLKTIDFDHLRDRIDKVASA